MHEAYPLGLFSVVEQPSLPACWRGLGALPCFHPHVARNLHPGTQGSLDHRPARIITHFLLHVVSWRVPAHKILQGTARIGRLREFQTHTHTQTRLTNLDI